MSEKKPKPLHPKADETFCEDQRLLEALAEYLADIAAEEQLKQASEKRKR
ncbi:MAG: hypothetical protein ABJN40_01540 [Sneathiella sp.]